MFLPSRSQKTVAILLSPIMYAFFRMLANSTGLFNRIDEAGDSFNRGYGDQSFDFIIGLYLNLIIIATLSEICLIQMTHIFSGSWLSWMCCSQQTLKRIQSSFARSRG